MLAIHQNKANCMQTHCVLDDAQQHTDTSTYGHRHTDISKLVQQLFPALVLFGDNCSADY